MSATEARELAAQIAAVGFGDDVQIDLSAPDRAPLWSRLLDRLVAERLTGLAIEALESGALQVRDEQVEELLDRHRAAMAVVLELERNLLTVVDAFTDADIDVVVLKGPSFAHNFYPDPTLRPFSDLDLLVRTRDWRRAGEALGELGFRRLQPEPRAGFDERFGKAADFHSPSGRPLDLHRTLVVGPFGLWVDPDELFGRTRAWELGGRPLRRLEDTAALLHACMHASLGLWPPLLLPLRDVLQIARVGAIDWELLQQLARGWRLMVVLTDAFRMASEVLGQPIPKEAEPIVRLSSRRIERRALAAYQARRDDGGVALATLLAIPGLRARAAYVRALLVPDSDFLAARMDGKHPPSYLRRWLIPVRWLRGRPGRVAGGAVERARR